jgi:hypothetical protein
MTVQRAQLYREVWAEPMTTVARRYEVSSVYLKRVCDALEIPCPGRGHWAKVAAGHQEPITRLPPASPGVPDRWEPGTALGVVARPPRAGAAQTDPHRHALLRAVSELFEKGRVTETGYLRPSKRVLPDIVVSGPMLSRAIDLASDLFLDLEARGCPVRLDNSFGARPSVLLEGEPRWPGDRAEVWCPAHRTVTFVDKVAFGLTLYEASENVEVVQIDGTYVRFLEALESRRRRLPNSTTHRYLPTGRLVLRAYAPHGGVSWQQEWREKKPGDLRHRFRTIRRELRAAIPTIKAMLEQAERDAEVQRQHWEAQSREIARQQEERRRAEALKTSRDQLLAIVERWALARRIEEFFHDVEQNAGRFGEDERARLSARLGVARQLLGGLDVLRHFSVWQSPADRLKSEVQEGHG